MGKKRIFFVTLLICSVGLGVYGLPEASSKEEQKKSEEKAGEAKAIDAGIEVTGDHPEIEEGISCNDCHEIKLDAKTTATQIWLTGESPGRAPGEGVMPKDKLWKEIEKIIGGIKEDSKTFVMGTSINNIPLTTTAEFTLDSEKKMLYGFHEKGTEKLLHIKTNPKVSLNWHKEFESFADFLCVQILGNTELIDGSSKDLQAAVDGYLKFWDNTGERSKLWVRGGYFLYRF